MNVTFGINKYLSVYRMFRKWEKLISKSGWKNHPFYYSFDFFLCCVSSVLHVPTRCSILVCAGVGFIYLCVHSQFGLLSVMHCKQILGGWGRLWFIVLTNFCGVNTSTVADFQQPLWCRWTWSWKEMQWVLVNWQEPTSGGDCQYPCSVFPLSAESLF